MANTTFNTRILLKYDTYSNWTTANPQLLTGEVAIATISSGNTEKVNSVDTPQILIKVGDGVNTYNSLPFASGLAADVYKWAKESSITIVGNESNKVVSGITWDSTLNNGKGGLKLTTASVATSTQYEDLKKIVDAINSNYLTSDDKKALQTAIDAKVSTSDFNTFKTNNTNAIADAKKAGTDAADALNAYKTSNDAAVKKVADDLAAEVIRATEAEAKALSDAKTHANDLNTAMDSRVDALEAKFGSGDGSVSDQIADAIAAEASARDTAISNAIGTEVTNRNEAIEEAVAAEQSRAEGAEKANADDIAAIKKDYLTSSDKADLQTQINTIMNNPDTEGVINSIAEFTQYIEDHGEIAEGFRTDIDANTQAITDLTNASADTYETKTDAANKLTEAKKHATDLNTAMDTRVKNLEAIDHEAYKAYADQAEKDAIASAKSYADGLAGNYATAAQGALADSALQKADITTGSANGTIAVEGTDVAVKGLGSAAYTASSAYDAAGAASTVKTELTTEINKKVDKVDGSRLMTNAEGTKLENIETDAQVNVIESIKVNGVALPISGKSVDISHNIADLEQDSGTYVIFNCGTATTVI